MAKRKAAGAPAQCGDTRTTNDDINQDVVDGIKLEHLRSVESAAHDLVELTHGTSPAASAEADYEEERTRRVERLARVLGLPGRLDVFGIDEAGVYHPPSRAGYLQWEERHERHAKLLLRFADVIEVLDRRMPPSSTCPWEMGPDMKRDLANLVLALPSGWRREVIALRAEQEQ